MRIVCRRYGLFILLLLFLTLNLSSNPYPYVLRHTFQIADCPQLNTSNIIITYSNCNGSDGQITGITGKGTGNLTFTWFKSDTKTQVGTNADLTGVPKGKYYIQLRDESKCIAVTSEDFFVGEKNSVTIDNAKTVITGTSCNGTDGSVTNIKAVNATQFTWTDGQNRIIASTANLLNVKGGNYTLTATNNSGCSATASYQITSNLFFPPIAQIDTIPGTCNSANKYAVTFNISDTDPGYPYVLTNGIAGTQVKNGYIVEDSSTPGKATITLGNLVPGNTYTLHIINKSNCEQTYDFEGRGVDFRIDTTNIVVHNDYCGQSIGAITGLKVIGLSGLRPDPYTWKDVNGKLVSPYIFLYGVPAGKYTLFVTDPLGCRAIQDFVIKDSTSIAVPPQLNDIKLCLPGKTFINVIKPDTGGFNLYDSTQTLVTSNKLGTFPVSVKKTTDYYVTHTTGTCESTKTKITIFVSLPGVEIPNTFTPNNDGINDYWGITGLKDYVAAQISIFTRDGQMVFYSVGYGRPFDGRLNGKELPGGVYYYTIDTNRVDCAGKIGGSLTLIR